MRLRLHVVACVLLVSLLSSCGGFFSYLQKRKAVKSGYVTQQGFVKEIPFEKYISDKFIIEARINGSAKTYRFIIDTGALSAISRELAEELGLIKKGNSNPLPHVIMDQMEIEGLVFNRVGTSVMDIAKDPFLAKCARVDGVIGSSVLKHFLWHFDFRNNRILVSDSYDSLPAASNAIDLPFTPDHYNRALVHCTFPNGVVKKIIFDTGGQGFHVSDKSLFYSLQNQVDYRVNYGLAGYGEKGPLYDTSYTARIPHFKVAQLPIDTVEVQFTKGPHNFVGWQFLQNYTVTFDWQRKIVRLVPYPQPVTVGSPQSFGLSLFYHLDEPSQEMHLQVAGIVKGSPAEKAGLKIGDRVIRVDSKDYRVITSECEVFKGVGEGGEWMRLTILKGSDEQEVTIRPDFVYGN